MSIERVVVVVENAVLAQAGGAIVLAPETLLPQADQAMSAQGAFPAGALIAHVETFGNETQITNRMTVEEEDRLCASLASGKKWMRFHADTADSKYNIIVVLSEPEPKPEPSAPSSAPSDLTRTFARFVEEKEARDRTLGAQVGSYLGIGKYKPLSFEPEVRLYMSKKITEELYFLHRRFYLLLKELFKYETGRPAIFYRFEWDRLLDEMVISPGKRLAALVGTESPDTSDFGATEVAVTICKRAERLGSLRSLPPEMFGYLLVFVQLALDADGLRRAATVGTIPLSFDRGWKLAACAAYEVSVELRARGGGEVVVLGVPPDKHQRCLETFQAAGCDSDMFRVVSQESDFRENGVNIVDESRLSNVPSYMVPLQCRANAGFAI